MSMWRFLTVLEIALQKITDGMHVDDKTATLLVDMGGARRAVAVVLLILATLLSVLSRFYPPIRTVDAIVLSAFTLWGFHDRPA